MPRPDHHNEIELNYLKSGWATYLLGGKKRRVDAGQLSVFWGAIPHQIIEFSTNDPYYVATIPLHSFLQWRLPDMFVQRLMQGDLLSDGSEDHATIDTFMFERWIADLSAPAGKSQKPVLLEMQARVMRFALDYCDTIGETIGHQHTTNNHLTALPDTSLSKVEQMACFIAQHYTQKLTIQHISDHVNLNPGYAMNLFQKSFGTTLVSFLTEHRIAHAQRLLTTTNESITDIALQSGFASISRFNEAFQRVNQCSPRSYRNAHSVAS